MSPENAAERERCAQICDSIAANAVLGTANECAVAIIAKGKNEPAK